MNNAPFGWRVAEHVLVTFGKQIGFPLWLLYLARLSCLGHDLSSRLPCITHEIKDLISWRQFLPLGCCRLRHWLCVLQRIPKDQPPIRCLQWFFSNKDLESFPIGLGKHPMRIVVHIVVYSCLNSKLYLPRIPLSGSILCTRQCVRNKNAIAMHALYL